MIGTNKRSLTDIALEQQQILGPELYKRVIEVAEYTDDLTNEELNELEELFR